MSIVNPPDFIMIPTQLLSDARNKKINIDLQDGFLFGYIYWFTKLKNEKCTANNNSLADLVGTTAATIQNSLVRLERRGYIERTYKDKNRRVRKEIKCLLTFGKRLRKTRQVPPGGGRVPPTSGTSKQRYVPPTGDQNKNKEEKLKRREATAKNSGVASKPQNIWEDSVEHQKARVTAEKIKRELQTKQALKTRQKRAVMAKQPKSVGSSLVDVSQLSLVDMKRRVTGDRLSTETI